MENFKIVNSTVLVTLQHKINFEDILKFISNAKLEKNSKFKAIVLKRGKGKGTSRIYESGKIVVLGTTSLNSATDHVLGWIAESKIENKIIKAEIKNLVASCSIAENIKLENYYSANKESSSFETELFPGLILKVKDNVKATVFHNGKFYLRGSTDVAELQACCSLLIAKLKMFPR